MSVEGQRRPGGPPSGRGRILVVDDEPVLLRALCDTLRDEGYETEGHALPEQALAAFEAGRHELLLADLAMPGMDGISLLRRLRERDPHLAGVIMTGEGTIQSAVDAMKSGASDFVLKPFRLGAVAPVLERSLAMRRLQIENAELQRQLEQRARELARSNNALARSNNALARSNSELEAFSFSVSHDLRAPLRAISGFTRILAEDHAGEFSGEARRLLGIVDSSARRLEHLVDALLRLSRLGRQPLARVRIDMGALAREALAELQAQGEPGASVEIGQLPPRDGDPTLLRQVYVNLIGNALKFSRGRDPARIELGAGPGPEGVVYWVRDNGVGFDMRYAERLFTAFQRLHKASDFEGIGIGLSLVQRIVQRHGGRVWAEAAPDRGATFFFSLPDSPSVPAAGDAEPADRP